VRKITLSGGPSHGMLRAPRCERIGVTELLPQPGGFEASRLIGLASHLHTMFMRWLGRRCGGRRSRRRRSLRAEQVERLNAALANVRAESR
jgi:hypothetical protein